MGTVGLAMCAFAAVVTVLVLLVRPRPPSYASVLSVMLAHGSFLQ